jgi:ferredoxin
VQVKWGEDSHDLWLALPPRLRTGLRRARISLDPLVGRLTRSSLDPEGVGWMRHLPALPRTLRRVAPAPVWPAPNTETPQRLRTVAGIWRDADAEEAAFREQPLHDFMRVHGENLPAILRHSWHFVLPAAPEMAKALARVPRLAGARAAQRRGGPALAGRAPAAAAAPSLDAARLSAQSLDAARLSAQIRAEAARLGISAVGFAAYDPKYTFAEYAGSHDQGSVIVCVYEQDWAATQTAPSARSERAAFRAYAELQTRAVALAEFVERQGHRAHPHSFTGEAVAIHYGVQAGLGQLGLNGQLLTPAAGSRARLSLITTDAQLVHDEPVDYGVHAICDACQACVQRCPVGAIPNRRGEHRGIRKAKIKTERCFPVVATAEGCAICMKVCPVQRYGLDALSSHFVASGGEILGKGSDELEGYVWPIDGRRYGPGEKPDAEARRALLNPPHWHPIDPSRMAPVDAGVSAPAQAPAPGAPVQAPASGSGEPRRPHA